MGKRIITTELYNQMCGAFREQPGDVSYAAKKCGTGYTTAKRAWHLGFAWIKNEELKKPIKLRIEEEQAYTRMKLEEEAALARQKEAEDETRRRRVMQEKALRDVTENRFQEAQMIRLARGASVAMLATLTSVSQGVAKLGVQVQKSLAKYSERDDLSIQEASNVVRLMATNSTALRQAIDASSRTMQMERLLLGEPGSIIGIQPVMPDITIEEAERRIASVRQALDMEKEMIEGKLLSSKSLPMVIEGGRK